MDKNLVLVSVSILFREQQGKTSWFLVKHSDSNEWELPKVIVRKGESSVRAALRIMGEKGGMTTKVLEEAGRAGGAVTTSDNKTTSQRYLYYLMILKNGSKETIGFGEYLWLEYTKAFKKLSSKREKTMLKSAKETLKKWKKEKKGKKEEDSDLPELE